LGTVRDISASGVYFVFPPGLRRGDKVEFTVPLKIEGASAGGVLFQCAGRVVRVDSKGSRGIGVAACIDRYRLLSPGDAVQVPLLEEPAR